MSRRPAGTNSPAFKGEGGTGRRQGRPNHRTAGGAFRTFTLIRSRHGNRSLKAALPRFRIGRRYASHAGGRCEVLHAKIGELTLENDF